MIEIVLNSFNNREEVSRLFDMETKNLLYTTDLERLFKKNLAINYNLKISVFEKPNHLKVV